MQPSYEAIRQLLSLALQEDIGRGDLTSAAILPPDQMMQAKLVAREPLCVSGIHIAGLAFAMVDEAIEFEPEAGDGQKVEAGQTLATISGPALALLSAERVALNILQRMSGVATLTNQYVQAVAGTKAHILDTRKTMPGMRELDKYAVLCGGGRNHRMRLDDGVLIKDNHIVAAGSISEAVKRVRNDVPHLTKIEVECDTLAQVDEAASLDIDIILLDNMHATQLSEAIKLIAGRCKSEASGGITLQNLADIAKSGVDYISIGALTHSAPAVDIGMDSHA